jgi:hypothetical protein
MDEKQHGRKTAWTKNSMDEKQHGRKTAWTKNSMDEKQHGRKEHVWKTMDEGAWKE